MISDIENSIRLQLILGQKPCFLKPIQLVEQKVNIHQDKPMKIADSSFGVKYGFQFPSFFFQFKRWNNKKLMGPSITWFNEARHYIFFNLLNL